ncbi:MAG: T9SS type A sorting domain-containing protein [Crocinitomicaceae bacterium]|nr:T9SS type A sorting domain-containing protein [Crocinitomicaceae bacterium]
MRLKNVLLLLFCIFALTSLDAAPQWIQRADFAAVGRHRTTSLSIGNKGYIGLGHYNGSGSETYFSDWWEYDPATNSWTQKVDYPGNNGNGELGAHGVGLEVVGYVGLGELNDYSLYKYDPVTNTWTLMTNAPTGGTFQDSGDFTIGHKAYFTRLNTTELWEYDADLDIWTAKNPLPFNAYYSFSGFSINGKGYMKVSNSSITLNEFWEYDPVTDTWLQKTPFPGYARLSSISFVQDNKGYIICGYGPGAFSDLTSEVWQYTPATDTWFQYPDFPGTKRRYSTGLSIGGRCYLGTGTNGTNFNDFWEFSAVAGTHEMFDESSFSVYPNPAVDFVEFHSEKTVSFAVIVFDASGKKVNTVNTENGDVRLNRDDLPSGSYFFKVEIDGAAVYSDRFDFL